MLRLLDFFRTRSVLQLFIIGTRILHCAPRLIVLGAKLVILQPDQHLIFLDLVALLHPDPLHAPRNLGVHVDLVVRHNVSARRQHHSAHIPAALGCRAHDLHFGCRWRYQAVHQSHQSQQDHNRDAAQDVPARPFRRLTLGVLPVRAVNPETLQVVVFGIDGHFRSSYRRWSLVVGKTKHNLWVPHPSSAWVGLVRG